MKISSPRSTRCEVAGTVLKIGSAEADDALWVNRVYAREITPKKYSPAMVAGAFPIVKLGYLAIKQISKPIANQIKRNAKSHPFFRKYVCMPPAQLYHWLEVNCRLRLMGMGKAQSVEKLSEEMAIELGAEMLGEFVVFTIAAATLLLEYNRSVRKEALKEEREKHQVLMLKAKLQDLDLVTAVQEAQIRELQRAVDNLEEQNKSLLTRLFGGGKSNKH